MRTTEVIRTEKRKPRLLRNKLKQNWGYNPWQPYPSGICVFTKFTRVGYTQKRYSIPVKKNTPVSAIKFVSQIYFITFLQESQLKIEIPPANISPMANIFRLALPRKRATALRQRCEPHPQIGKVFGRICRRICGRETTHPPLRGTLPHKGGTAKSLAFDNGRVLERIS